MGRFILSRAARSRSFLAWGCLALLALVAALWGQTTAAQAQALLQQPTVSIPTVTGTPRGALVRVLANEPQINVRGGPSIDYPKVGVLIAGQEATAIGRSPGGEWIQIVYSSIPEGVAWVYAPYVSQPTESLPIAAPPPTPTLAVTPTIDPTLVGQYNLEMTPTRLPTFTPPPPISYPDFQDEAGSGLTARLPVGMIIFGLLVIGLFGAVISLIRGR